MACWCQFVREGLMKERMEKIGTHHEGVSTILIRCEVSECDPGENYVVPAVLRTSGRRDFLAHGYTAKCASGRKFEGRLLREERPDWPIPLGLEADIGQIAASRVHLCEAATTFVNELDDSGRDGFTVHFDRDFVCQNLRDSGRCEWRKSWMSAT